MEPHSADKIKRKKRKYHDPRERYTPLDGNIIIPFKLLVRKDIYEGKEKKPFKKRDPEFQAILRNEFE
ncbi:MAG: hypothetical protein ACFE8L_12260 [Candidatus Hodarchaeota archaeon]